MRPGFVVYRKVAHAGPEEWAQLLLQGNNIPRVGNIRPTLEPYRPRAQASYRCWIEPVKDDVADTEGRPKLAARCSKETPFTSRTPIIVHDGKGVVLWTGDCYYIRAQVENSGKTRAEKVQVYASKLLKRGADNKFTELQSFIPLNCKWSNSPPGGVSAILDSISPRMAAFFDSRAWLRILRM